MRNVWHRRKTQATNLPNNPGGWWMETFTIATLLAITSGAQAQEAWQIEGYNRKSTLLVDTVKRVARISTYTDGQPEVRDYQLEKQHGHFRVMDGSNGASALKFLHLDAVRVNDKYASLGQNLTAADKLIQRALQLPEQTMHIEDASPGSTVAEEDGALEMPADSESQPVMASGKMSKWWLLPALVLGGLLGLWLRPKRKNTAAEKATNAPVSTLEIADNLRNEKPGKAEKVGELRAQIKTLSASEKKLKQEILLAQQELKAQQVFNETYYNAAYKKLVLPAQEAMEKGHKTMLLETMIKMSAQYASLTRAMLQRKLGHDEGNLRYLGEGKSDTAATTISKHTPLDEVPNNIHVVMDLLRQEGSKGLDETLIAGYKIKDI